MTSADILRLSGVTPRMLYHWSQRRLIKRIKYRPPISKGDAFAILIFAELRAKGMRLEIAKQMAKRIDQAFVTRSLQTEPSEFYAGFSGLAVQYSGSAAAIIKWSRAQSGVQVVDVAGLWNKICNYTP